MIFEEKLKKHKQYNILIVILRYIVKTMGLTKEEKFTKEQNELAKMAKAFGHPARIAILEYLIKTNACVCGDLVDEIGLAQATISQHLKELKLVGIIQGNIEGTSVCYCINPTKWETMNSLFSGMFESFPSENSCC